MDVVIYKAVESDVSVVADIRRDAFTRYAAGLGGRHSIDALSETAAEILHQINDSDVYILSADGVAAGTVRISLKLDGSAKLSRYGVKAEYENAGLGQQLMDQVLHDVQKAGVHTVYLYTALAYEGLVRFYERNGFKVCAVSEERGYQRARMEKRV